MEESVFSVALSDYLVDITLLTFFFLVFCFLHRRKSPPKKPGIEFIYNKQCPICFTAFRFPIKSNCGHAFCMNCIYNYWEKSTWKTKCPLCRSPLKHLQIIEDGYQYAEKTRRSLLKKIDKISSNKKPNILLSIPLAGYLCSLAISLVWTFVIINRDALRKWGFTIYKYLYELVIYLYGL